MPHIQRLLQIQNDKVVYWSILLNSQRVKRIFLFTKRICNCFSSFGLLEYNILQTKQSIRNWTEFPLCLEHLQDRCRQEATSSRRTLYPPYFRKGRKTIRDPSVWSLFIRVLYLHEVKALMTIISQKPQLLTPTHCMYSILTWIGGWYHHLSMKFYWTMLKLLTFCSSEILKY